LVRDHDRLAEFAREVAEAELDVLRIRRVRALHFKMIVGNPDVQSEAYPELAKNPAKLAR